MGLPPRRKEDRRCSGKLCLPCIAVWFRQIERVPYPTGTVQVTLDAVGVPCYEIKEGVAWDNIPFTDELKRLALNTRAVCFGSLAQRSETSRITINRFLDTMPDAEGQLKIFDINLRQGFYTKEILCESMRRCNILKINDEELVTISRISATRASTCRTNAGFCWLNIT